MSRSRTVVCGLCLITGCLMALVALSVSNSVFEHALLGNTARHLGWGTTLFRGLLAAHGIALVISALASWRSRQFAADSLPPESHQTAGDSLTNKSPWLVLTALSVVALGLRLWHLNSDLWYDELISLLDFIRPPLGQIVTSFSSQNQHMLYSILAHGCVALFGESAWAIRLPAVGFGVGSLWALFFLGRKVIGQREALFACALMTVSYHHIWFSQNARGYMGLLFFSTLATWLLLEALSHDSWKFWIGYVAAVSLGVWVHMTMAFVVAAHGILYIALLLSPRFFTGLASSRKIEAGSTAVSRSGWKPVVAGLLIVSVTLQLHALALPDFLGSALHMQSLPSEWSSPWWVIIESLRSLRVGFSGLMIVVPGIVLVGVGWWSILRRNPLAGIAMILPALLGGATMLVLGHYLWPRFFFFSMGFALLIVVHGAVTLPRLVSRHLRAWPALEPLSGAAGVVLALLMILASAVTVPRNYAHPKQDYSGARDYVESRRGPNDAVVAVGLAGAAYERYYAPSWSVAQTNAELDAARPAGGNIWLVYTLPVEVKAYRPEIWQTIQSDFAIVKVFPGTLGGGEVVVCRQRSKNDQGNAIGRLVEPH
jgi:mannosyltransferase